MVPIPSLGFSSPFHTVCDRSFWWAPWWAWFRWFRSLLFTSSYDTFCDRFPNLASRGIFWHQQTNKFISGNKCLMQRKVSRFHLIETPRAMKRVIGISTQWVLRCGQTSFPGGLNLRFNHLHASTRNLHKSEEHSRSKTQLFEFVTCKGILILDLLCRLHRYTNREDNNVNLAE